MIELGITHTMPTQCSHSANRSQGLCSFYDHEADGHERSPMISIGCNVSDTVARAQADPPRHDQVVNAGGEADQNVAETLIDRNSLASGGNKESDDQETFEETVCDGCGGDPIRARTCDYARLEFNAHWEKGQNCWRRQTPSLD